MLKRVCPAVAGCTERLAVIVWGCRALGENEAETQLKCLVFALFASQIDFLEIRARLLFAFGSQDCVSMH